MTTAVRRVLAVALLVVATAASAIPVEAGQGAAPAFALQLFNGQTLRLADLKGTAVILLFWAPW